jgi:UPF0755 protein
LSTIIVWAKIAALAWGCALLVVLLAETGFLQRLIPNWVRSLARVAVLVGTIAAVATGVLLGVRLVTQALEARPQTGKVSLNLSFASPDKFVQSVYLSMHQAELNQPASSDATEVAFVVQPGETATEVAARLAQDGLVVNGDVFRRFMSYNGLDLGLQAGTYTLRANMTMPELAAALQHGSSGGVTVTIPEGWRAEQIGWLLEQQGVMRSDDFMAEVRGGQFDYSFLAGRPQGASLEGFLFPDTYQFPTQATPKDVVDRMLADFEVRVMPKVGNRMAGRQIFDPKSGSYRPLSLLDVITLASIVEREAQVPQERPIIASVYFNRLDPKYVNETALRLSSDPTIQYAKGYDPKTGNWWNPMQPGEGQDINSPYNTFKVQGLPPGPISNPGLASIEAVLSPAQTTYLYFHAVGDGSHVFASTLEEHLRNQEKYKP